MLSNGSIVWFYFFFNSYETFDNYIIMSLLSSVWMLLLNCQNGFLNLYIVLAFGLQITMSPLQFGFKHKWNLCFYIHILCNQRREFSSLLIIIIIVASIALKHGNRERAEELLVKLDRAEFMSYNSYSKWNTILFEVDLQVGEWLLILQFQNN